MIGILGGTFDPIHNGHLRTALDVQQALGLEEIRLVPLRDPPHRETPLTTPEQRLEMVYAASRDNPLFKVDERELKREGKSYSVDTLHSLRAELGSELPICLIMGSDAFQGFADWHQPEEILKLAHLVIMQRPEESPGDHSREHFTREPGELRQKSHGLILFQPVTQLDISATAIRGLISQNHSPRYLVPESVLAIIEARQLYR
ncbi:MAG: nicotinate-nucleotide adenylyltransferase [Candidatus Sedimenticola sp. 20ELBAFRAG]